MSLYVKFVLVVFGEKLLLYEWVIVDFGNCVYFVLDYVVMLLMYG